MRCRKDGGGSDSRAFDVRFDIVLLRVVQQSAAQVESGGAMAVGEEPVMLWKPSGNVCSRKRRMNLYGDSQGDRSVWLHFDLLIQFL